MDARSWHAGLIGQEGSRWRLDTPALVLDLPALRHNIAAMARFAAERGMALRPHVKSHKSVDVARCQVEAGAIGVSCATLSEASAMVDAGIPGVLVTSPLVTQSKIERGIDLARQAGPSEFIVVVDHEDNVEQLARAASAQLTHPLSVMVDHQAGYGRTGVADMGEALRLAAYIKRATSLRLVGLQAYAGNLQHLLEVDERRRRCQALQDEIRALLDAARKAGTPFNIVSGGGTGSHMLDADSGVFTELQPGSYVFMDAEYLSVLQAGGGSCPYQTALLVQTTVVSRPVAREWVTVDGGTKCFSTDAGLPLIAMASHSEARYAFFGDEHGKLFVKGERPAVGNRIEFITPHCDPTVNLHDDYCVVDGDRLVALWRVDARGHR